MGSLVDSLLFQQGRLFSEFVGLVEDHGPGFMGESGTDALTPDGKNERHCIEKPEYHVVPLGGGDGLYTDLTTGQISGRMVAMRIAAMAILTPMIECREAFCLSSETSLPKYCCEECSIFVK